MRHAWAVLLSAALTLFLANATIACAGERVLTLENGIDATLNVPDGIANAPAVLMLHGFASQKNEVGDMYTREAKALADKGIASLRISFRGFGKSDGDTGSATIDQMVDDAVAAGHYLAGLPGIDSHRLGVLGFSLGGGVTLIATAKEPDLFKSRVTWSSVGDFVANFKGVLGQKAFDKAEADGIVGLDLDWRTIALKKAFFESLKSYSIKDAIPRFKRAYLAIAGSNDFSVAYVSDFVHFAPGSTKEAVIIPGADHIYEVLSKDQTDANHVITITAEWFAKTL
jgi:pimeloyl-ACP methyl ester carboxylesterase